jgi:hypothetical protein
MNLINVTPGGIFSNHSALNCELNWAGPVSVKDGCPCLHSGFFLTTCSKHIHYKTAIKFSIGTMNGQTRWTKKQSKEELNKSDRSNMESEQRIPKMKRILI